MARGNSSRSNRGNRSNQGGDRRSIQSGYGVMELARERPLAAAAVAAGTAAAGLFLWSKRTQISEQLSSLSDQFGEWTESMNFGQSGETDEFDDTAGLTTTSGTRTARGMSETGGGNASLGAHSGGGGTATATGRGRAQKAPTS